MEVAIIDNIPLDCKDTRHWHIIIDGSGCPETCDVVVAVWVSTTETMAELAYYDKENDEWFSANPNTKDDPVCEPDYWIEFPD